MWLGLAFIGVVLIALAKSDADYIGTDYVAGILMALGAAFFYALAAIITKKLSDTPPHIIALAQVCVGAVILAPFANLSTLPALIEADLAVNSQRPSTAANGRWLLSHPVCWPPRARRRASSPCSRACQK
ncbi:hypothetical protein J7E70_34305 [Variovorax paradoxus]|nr:hypothetical protein [Variovorax paradoxus]MBT2305468.1 hypothetical protein [Variovorax paradoxus]